MKQLNPLIKLGVAIALLFSHFIWINQERAYALTDGAYIVGTSATYANPETGLIVDGGTNLELGTSAAQSITLSTALVEISGGRTFVTIGLGQASNIQNPRIMVQHAPGVDAFRHAGITQTGTSLMDGDSVLHLRFEVTNPNVLISPIIYVSPMGRDVQFFIRLNMGSATPGTGIFLSEMVAASTSEPGMPVEAVESEVEIEVLEEETFQRYPVDLGEISLEGVIGLVVHEIATDEEE